MDITIERNVQGQPLQCERNVQWTEITCERSRGQTLQQRSSSRSTNVTLSVCVCPQVEIQLRNVQGQTF